MSKITPFLWFNNQAEEAMSHYIAIFKNSRIVSVSRYGDAGPVPRDPSSSPLSSWTAKSSWP